MEKLDEFGNTVQPRRPHGRSQNTRVKCKRDAAKDVDTDVDDDNFVSSSSSDVGSSDGDDSEVGEISNEELADMLPLKTIPEVNRKGQGRTLKPKAKVLTAAPPKKKVKTHSVEVEEVEDEDSARNLRNRNASVLSVTGDVSQKKKKGIKKNAIHLFYEVVPTGDDGKLGDDGDIHYRCLHGAHKVCTIKKTMKSNLTGVQHCVSFV